jgi:hypothetical protein
MKLSLITLFFLSCGSAAVYAQGGVTSHVAESRVEQLKWLSPTGSPIHGFDNRTSEVKGSPYLFDNWVEGDITTNSGKKVDSLEINYDILNHLVEIKVNKVVKAASEAEISGFSIIDKYGQKRNFISLSKYHLPDTKLVGFAEVLFEGDKISLIKKYEIKYIEPNYVEHFDVGSMDAQLLKKDHYYLLRDNKLEEFHKRKSFGDKKKVVKAFVRKNGLDLRKERGMVYAVEYFNFLL